MVWASLNSVAAPTVEDLVLCYYFIMENWICKYQRKDLKGTEFILSWRSMHTVYLLFSKEKEYYCYINNLSSLLPHIAAVICNIHDLIHNKVPLAQLQGRKIRVNKEGFLFH